MEERFEAFTVLIARLSRSIRRIKAEEMADFGLKVSHVSCLYYLHCAGALTASELCERCEEDKAAVSRAVDELEAGGYLTGESSGKKRYKSPLRLTEKGAAVGEKIARKIDGVVAEANAKIWKESAKGTTKNERKNYHRFHDGRVPCLSASGARRPPDHPLRRHGADRRRDREPAEIL